MTPSFLFNPNWPTLNGDTMKITFNKTKPAKKSTITAKGNSFVVTRPDGSTIKCHNRATAQFFVKNPAIR